MKKTLLSLFLVITGVTFAFAQNTVTRSAISFKIKNLGINTGGSLGGLKATVKFDPANLVASTIEAAVDVSTINTDNSTRDEHLRSDNFFDVTRYPTISLKSISIKHKSGNNYAGQFNLTIKDKTKPVQIPFSLTDKGNSLAFSGTFKINRLDYGVGTNSLTLSDEVTIIIDAEVSK